MERWTDSLVGKIKGGLFGDENYSGPNGLPKVEVRPLVALVRELVRVGEENWYPYAFSREPLNGRFDDDLRRDLMQRSISCGRDLACECRQRYGKWHPQALAEELGVSVNHPSVPQGGDRVLFAEFLEPDTINLYRDGLDKCREVLRDEELRQLIGSVSVVSNILLAHELFHVFEMRRGDELWTNSYRFDIIRLTKRIAYNARISVLGEIAAMAFAKEACGISYSPYVLDVLLTYGYSPEASCALYDDMASRLGLGSEPRLPESGEDAGGDGPPGDRIRDGS